MAVKNWTKYQVVKSTIVQIKVYDLSKVHDHDWKYTTLAQSIRSWLSLYDNKRKYTIIGGAYTIIGGAYTIIARKYTIIIF